MPNQPPLNPDALAQAKAAGVDCRINGGSTEDVAECAVEAYLAVAQPVVNSAVESFVNQRPEYVTVLKNTRSGDDMSDYCRWQGHAEARRQLAQKLGWAVPHNPGETTRPVVDDA